MRRPVRLFWGLLLYCLALGALGAELRRHEVMVEGHPIRVWEKAPAQAGPHVLLLHGLTWSTRPNFDLQVPGETLSLMDGLNQHGIRAFGMDQRGYGETPRDASGWLDPEKAARDVIGVLTWMATQHPGAPAPFLFGWSYGAALAQLVVQQRADLVSGLVVFGYPVRPGFDRDPDGVAGEPVGSANTADAAASDFIVPGAISGPAVEAYVAAALAADPVKVDWRGRSQWQLLDAAQVRVPTLLLQAEHDPLALADVHSEFFNRLGTRDKAWAMIPDSGHAAFLERRRGYFLQLLGTFLNRQR
jgi:alpha-beta hydrolase superfamily lysophospholipase